MNHVLWEFILIKESENHNCIRMIMRRIQTLSICLSVQEHKIYSGHTEDASV